MQSGSNTFIQHLKELASMRRRMGAFAKITAGVRFQEKRQAVLANGIDVAERKLMEETLRDSEKKYRDVF